MANEAFGSTDTILSITLTASQQNSTVLYPKGAELLFLYSNFDYSSSNLNDFRVEISDDGGTTWRIEPLTWRTTALSADEKWRSVVNLGYVQGTNANRQVRVGATGAGTTGTLVVKARFNRRPYPAFTA